jgi:SAM-dependent methyltransferase
MTSAPEPGLPVPPELQRSGHDDRQEWIDSGVFAVELLDTTAGRGSLAEVDLLDVGCGTKVVKTLLDGGIPIGSYTGVDVAAPVIEWLTEHVDDPRFEFHHFPARNDLYNPTGPRLAEFERLPVGDRQFDLICLFSVFTHLDPEDYVAMLRLLRGHVRPDGRLVFSVFINDPEHPSTGDDILVRAIEAGLASDDPEIVARTKAAIAAAPTSDGGYLDEVADVPLLRTRFDKDFAIRLVEGTGWDIVSVNPPQHHIQHYFVCRPAPD